MAEAIQILVDADACPVKEQVYKVAFRLRLPVSIVANSYMRIPDDALIERVVVDTHMDAADDYIADHSGPGSVVITADILLADRCLKKGAAVIAPNGRLFTENSIGSAVATRAIMADLRAGGEQIGGAPPFTRADRSRFLSALDQVIVRLRRSR